MDHDAASLTGIPPRGLWKLMERGENMTGFQAGDRVFFGDTDAIGTVVDAIPDSCGLLRINWDGCGIYRENPVHLRPAVEDPA